MRIPLVGLLRRLRERQSGARKTTLAARLSLVLWAFFAKRPALYHLLGSLLVRLSRVGRRRGWIRAWPKAGGWGTHFPAPEGTTFQVAWREHKRDRE